MASIQSDWARFRDLVFSDLQRYRAEAPSWAGVLGRCLSLPGMLASLILRAQQVLHDRGSVRLASRLRTLGVVLVGMDLHPGATVGRGFMLAHPNGVTMGGGIVIGDNVTFAGGVTCAVRVPDAIIEQEFATISDGAVIGAHAVLVGGVKIGRNAMVGSNSVVLSDVPDEAVVFGVPARRIGNRDPDAAPAADV